MYEGFRRKNSFTEPTKAKISCAISNAHNSAGSYSINLEIQKTTQVSTKKQSESQTTPKNTRKNAVTCITALKKCEEV